MIQFTGDCYNESVPKEKNRNLKNTFAENEMECMNHDENELEKDRWNVGRNGSAGAGFNFIRTGSKTVGTDFEVVFIKEYQINERR